MDLASLASYLASLASHLASLASFNLASYNTIADISCISLSFYDSSSIFSCYYWSMSLISVFSIFKRAIYCYSYAKAVSLTFSVVVLGCFYVILSFENLASLFLTEDAKSDAKKSLWWNYALGIFSSSSSSIACFNPLSSSEWVYSVRPAAVKLLFCEIDVY